MPASAPTTCGTRTAKRNTNTSGRSGRGSKAMSTTTTIQLSKGRTAIVDEVDAHGLKQYKWCFAYRPKMRSCDGYAVTNINGKTILMHRMLVDAPCGMEVDHINGNGLDNRRSNIRLATSQQNKANRKVRNDSVTGLKGVTWNQSGKQWMARITVDRKCLYLGCFSTPMDAHLAYRQAAKKHFGEFAKF